MRSRCSRYEALVGRGLKLDMTRGKPSPPSWTCPTSCSPCRARATSGLEDGVDCRNYGGTVRAARAAGDLRAAAQRPGRPADRRRQRQPGDHARHPGVLPAQGHGRLLRSVVARHRQVPLPGPWLRSPLRAVRAVRDRDDPGGARPARSRSRRGTELVAEDPAIKGIWIVPTYANPERRGLHRGGHPGTARDGRRGRGLPDLLGQRVRGAPPDRRRDSCAGHPGAGRGGGQPEPAVPVRLDLQDHLRRGGVSFFAGSAAQRGLVPEAPGKRTIGPTRSTTCGTRCTWAVRTGARADAAAPGACWLRSSTR